MATQHPFAFGFALRSPINPSTRFHSRQVTAPRSDFRIAVRHHATLSKNEHSENKMPDTTTTPPSVNPFSRLHNFVNNIPVPTQNAILLSIVPCLWGTSGVAAKILFSQSSPMPPSLVNLSSFAVAYFSLVITSSLSSAQSTEETYTCNQQQARDTLRSGAELGVYLYIGSMLNLEALSRTSASRAAFFVQLTTVFVPIAGALLGESLQPQIVVACTLALLGASVLSQSKDNGMETLGDHQVPTSATAPLLGGLNIGDCLAIATAVLYRFVTYLTFPTAMLSHPVKPLITKTNKSIANHAALVMMQCTCATAGADQTSRSRSHNSRAGQSTNAGSALLCRGLINTSTR